MADDDRPQYQHGVGTINGTQFHWGSGTPGKYWSIPYGDYPVTPNAPTGAWAQSAGAIPIANNVIPDPQLGRNRIGIMIHSGSAPSLDQLYTEGCFKVDPQDWPNVRSQILAEAEKGPLYLHVAPGGVAAFTNTKTFSQAGEETPAANANAAANTTAAAAGPSRPTSPTPGTTLFAGVNPDARGMRNNNPGNLEANSWTSTLPGYAGSDGRFAIFDTAQHGAAALDQNLTNYASKGINTPFAVASTWAPASDNNDPNSYGAQIAKGLGVGLNDKIDLSDPTVRSKISQSIALVENGPGKSAGINVPYGTTLNTAQNAPVGAGPGRASAGSSGSPASTAATAALPGFAPAQSNQFLQGVSGLDKAMGGKGLEGQPGYGDGGQDQMKPSPMIPAPPLHQPNPAQAVQNYGQILTSMRTPLQWGSATPGAQTPAYATAGQVEPPPGTSLNSLQQLEQLRMMGMMGSSMPGGGFGYG